MTCYESIFVVPAMVLVHPSIATADDMVVTSEMTRDREEDADEQSYWQKSIRVRSKPTLSSCSVQKYANAWSVILLPCTEYYIAEKRFGLPRIYSKWPTNHGTNNFFAIWVLTSIKCHTM